MYTVAVEHFVQVAVRVSRGIQEADRTLTHLRHVLHCLMCEEYAICPDTRTPIGECAGGIIYTRTPMGECAGGIIYTKFHIQGLYILKNPNKKS